MATVIFAVCSMISVRITPVIGSSQSTTLPCRASMNASHPAATTAATASGTSDVVGDAYGTVGTRPIANKISGTTGGSSPQPAAVSPTAAGGCACTPHASPGRCA